MFFPRAPDPCQPSFVGVSKPRFIHLGPINIPWCHEHKCSCCILLLTMSRPMPMCFGIITSSLHHLSLICGRFGGDPSRPESWDWPFDSILRYSLPQWASKEEVKKIKARSCWKLSEAVCCCTSAKSRLTRLGMVSKLDVQQSLGCSKELPKSCEILRVGRASQ